MVDKKLLFMESCIILDFQFISESVWKWIENISLWFYGFDEVNQKIKRSKDIWWSSVITVNLLINPNQNVHRKCFDCETLKFNQFWCFSKITFLKTMKLFQMYYSFDGINYSGMNFCKRITHKTYQDTKDRFAWIEYFSVSV